MSALSKLRRFLSKHGNKFIIGGVAVGSIVLLTRYAQTKLKEWQEKQAQEFLCRSRKQQHFESITRTCNQTIKSLSVALYEALCKTINTEEMIASLVDNPKNKIEIWDELKIQIFTRVSCLIYLFTMLVITLTVQLSIIGGYLYKDPNSISPELQEKYLSHCQNLMKNGMQRLVTIIEAACKNIFSPISLKKQVKISDLEALLWSIQTAVCEHSDNPIDNLRKYIFEDDIPKDDELYFTMLQDTADLLESEEVKGVVHHCINRGFILLMDLLAEYYDDGNVKIKELVNGEDPNSFVNPYNTGKPLAKLLPIINGLVAKKSLPDRLTHMLVTNEKIQNLGANVYESLL